MDTQTETQKRKRKALLVLPLIALPFVALAFWSLGGGSGSTAQGQPVQTKGLNTALPAAQLSAGPQDKMSLYSKAADSGALNAYADSNPYAMTDSTAVSPEDSTLSGNNPSAGYGDADEVKLQARLAQLQQALHQPPPANGGYDNYNQQPALQDEDTKADIARLQQMMQAMQRPDSAADPQMQQMNGMLDKLLDIEHPERAEEQLRRQSLKNRGRVYAVSQPREQDKVSLFGSDSSRMVFSGSGFYGLEEQDAADTLPAATPAVVQGTQTVTSGATIKLRLTAGVMVSGIVIPKGNFIYGSCNVDGERLKIQLTGIRYQDHLFPVSLSVYDLDALEGIRIPGAISRDASKEGADRAVQSMQLMSLDPSLGAQAASAGLEAAKGLISKKVKLVRVTVKAGYPVLLMDEKAKQENNF